MTKQKHYRIALFLGVLACILSICVCNTSADAASKPYLDAKKVTLGIANTYSIYIENSNSKATYTYASSNKKVAKVNKKGVVTTIKAGTAKITVKQKLKGKTTKVGTLKVTVKKATCFSFKKGEEFWCTAQKGYWSSGAESWTLSTYDFIQYQNYKAKYTFYSMDKSKLKIKTNGKITYTGKAGRVKIKVKETYKKKTRTVGTFYLCVKEPVITEKKITVTKGEHFEPYYYTTALCQYYAMVSDSATVDSDMSFERSDDGDEIHFVRNEDDEWTGEMYITEAGTYYVHFFPYDYSKKSFDTSYYLGYIEVTVEAHDTANKIQMDFEKYPDDYDEDDYNSTDGYCLKAGNDQKISFYIDPYNYTGDYTITSSDPSVVTAAIAKSSYLDDEDGYAGRVLLSPKKAGTATITLEANGASTTFKVTVLPRELYGEDEVYSTRYYLKNSMIEGSFSSDKLTITSSDKSIATMTLDDFDEEDDFYEAFYTIETFEKSGDVTFTVTYDGKVIDTFTCSVSADEY